MLEPALDLIKRRIESGQAGELVFPFITIAASAPASRVHASF
jgi:hypothetical protein